MVINDFKEKTYVSFREFCQKDGKQLPTAKGDPISVKLLYIFFIGRV